MTSSPPILSRGEYSLNLLTLWPPSHAKEASRRVMCCQTGQGHQSKAKRAWWTYCRFFRALHSRGLRVVVSWFSRSHLMGMDRRQHPTVRTGHGSRSPASSVARTTITGAPSYYEPLYICSASTVPVPSQTWRLSKFTSRYCSPWPKALIPAMLSKPRVGAADLFKASGPDWLRCVRGEREEKGERGLSHVLKALQDAPLPRQGPGQRVDTKTPGMPRRGGGGGGIEPRYQSDTTLESPIAKSEAMGSSHITALTASQSPSPRGPSVIFKAGGSWVAAMRQRGGGPKQGRGLSHPLQALQGAPLPRQAPRQLVFVKIPCCAAGGCKTGSRTIEALSKTDINKTQSCRPNIINGAFSYHGTAPLGPKPSSL